MPSRPNYRQERAQKTRNREAKKEEKLRRREEASAKRKALREGDASAQTDAADKDTVSWPKKNGLPVAPEPMDAE